MMDNGLLRDSVQRAALAVAIVFSIAVVIAVSDPRRSESVETVESVGTQGRRSPPPVPPTATQADVTADQPPVAIEAPLPTTEPNPTQSLLEIVASQADRAGLRPAVVPAGGCVSSVPIDAGIPATFSCDPGAVVATATGRVLVAHTSTRAPVSEAPLTLSSWRWDRGLSLGSFVVIDHGPAEGAASVITVYSRLSDVDPALVRGEVVEAGQRIGGLGVDGDGLRHSFGWEMWINDQLTGVTTPLPPPAADGALFEATELASIATLPAPTSCSFPLGDRIGLPNSARTYRSGVHEGIDFGCGTPGLTATSFADGTVTMVVEGIVEPSFANRELLLANAATAGKTPLWTLIHLYGNFVVIDHGDIPNVGEVYSIYAHLADLDPGIQIGGQVLAGQPIGEIGNSGTSIAAQRAIDSQPETIHLHWELQIDDHYLSEGLSAAATEQVYRSLLCRATDNLSCT